MFLPEIAGRARDPEGLAPPRGTSYTLTPNPLNLKLET